MQWRGLFVYLRNHSFFTPSYTVIQPFGPPLTKCPDCKYAAVRTSLDISLVDPATASRGDRPGCTILGLTFTLQPRRNLSLSTPSEIKLWWGLLKALPKL